MQEYLKLEEEMKKLRKANKAATAKAAAVAVSP
jgi:hypothetical protein